MKLSQSGRKGQESWKSLMRLSGFINHASPTKHQITFRLATGFINVILVLAIAGCSFSNPFLPRPTSTATLAPSAIPTLTSTPTPIPTQTPTPVPAKRIEDGDYALFIGDYSQALQIFQDAGSATIDPQILAAALFGKSRAELMLGDTTAALNDFKTMADGNSAFPQTAEDDYFLGQIYGGLERYSDAVAAYDQYLKLRPGIIDSHVQELRGDALANSGNYVEAAAAYQTAADSPHLGDSERTEVKEASSKALSGDLAGAITIYKAIYDSSTNDYIKAQMDFLIGNNDLSLGNSQEGYLRFLDAVNNFPSSNDSYQGLVILVNASVPVDDLNRGLVDYFAGQYDVALQAFERYLSDPTSTDAGTAHYYKALTLRSIGEVQYPLGSDARNSLAAQNALPNDQNAIVEWQTVTQDYPTNSHWVDAWEDIAYTQWVYLNQPVQAAQTLVDAAAADPQASAAPGLLYDAGRYFERADKLSEAAQTWESLAKQYPNASETPDALAFAGICYYRTADYSKAQADFQLLLSGTTDPAYQAKALFWIGKTQKIQNDRANALVSWQQAATKDPTGYYSDRARDLLVNLPPFTTSQNTDLTIDLPFERTDAINWMRTTFTLAQDVDLTEPGNMASDLRMQRGLEFWQLGLYDQAKAEFQDLQNEVKSDPANTFRLIQFFVDLGLYQPAIFASRQVLTLAGMDDAATLTAPIYFNHVRFGLYFKDQVLAAAQAENLDPLFVFSLMRQESLFDGTIQSSAGAVGLMQLMPATAQEVVTNMGWPDPFVQSDLTRPVINIPLGVHYLAQYRTLLNDNLYAMLAAYNGGPGNAAAWESLAPDDPDLFVEVVRIQETRDYITSIVENYEIYKQIYASTIK